MADKLCLENLSEKEWELLIRQAKSANLAAKLADSVHREKLDIPAKAQLHFNSEQLLTSRQISVTRYELEKIAEVFKRQEIKVILLKGAAYIALNFEFSRNRKLLDIDLLVRKKDISDAERELIFFGWAPHEVDDYDEVYYREWMHEIPPLKHRNRGSVIDLHHNIFPPISGVSPDASQLIAQAVCIKELGVWRLCNEDMFIHSAVHFFLQSETHNGLRDLNDMKELYRLFSGENERFPFQLLSRARQLNMLESVLLAFRYMRKIFGLTYPKELEDEIARENMGKVVLLWLDFLYENVLIPHHSSCINWHFNLASFFVFWRGHIKKMPFQLLAAHLTRKSYKRMVEMLTNDAKQALP